jgi:hypothetical protein
LFKHWQNLLFLILCFLLAELQKKYAMLGRHLAAVGGISCLIVFLFSTSRAAEKESHAWKPSVWRWWHQLSNNRCFPFPGLQKKKAMLGRHLAAVEGISCLIAVVLYFQGCRKRKPCLDAILLE